MTTSEQKPSPEKQRSLFASFAFGGLAVVIYLFCVQPAQEGIERAKQELTTAQMQETGAVRDIQGAKDARGRLESVREARKPFLAGLLEPLLESYSMRAKSVLDPIAADSGIAVLDYSEQPKRLLPLPKPAPRQLYARQPIRLTCRGSYAGIISFLLRVERKLPLVALQSMSLKAQTANDVQTAEMVFEWPVLGALQQLPGAKGGPAK